MARGYSRITNNEEATHTKKHRTADVQKHEWAKDQLGMDKVARFWKQCKWKTDEHAHVSWVELAVAHALSNDDTLQIAKDERVQLGTLVARFTKFFA